MEQHLWPDPQLGKGKGRGETCSLLYCLAPFAEQRRPDGLASPWGIPLDRAPRGRAGSSYLGWPGRVRLQFGEPQVGGGLLLFPGSWRFVVLRPPPPTPSFSSSRFPGWEFGAFGKVPATARDSPGGAGPGFLSPPPLAGFPPLWPHPRRFSPPPTLPLSLPPRLILTSGRESRALSCLPASPGSHRARRAENLRPAPLPLLSPPTPSLLPGRSRLRGPLPHMGAARGFPCLQAAAAAAPPQPRSA